MVVALSMAISLDALTEVGVFRANRGVVLQFSCFSCFFPNDIFAITFFIVIYFVLPMLFSVVECFTFDLVMRVIVCVQTSHLMSHWSDSFHDSLNKSSVAIMSH